MWHRTALVVLMAVSVAHTQEPRNVMFGWCLFGMGVTLHRGEEYERGLVAGLGISVLIWISGVATQWYHCLGYSVICTTILRFFHDVCVMVLGVGIGVTTWMVCLTRVQSESVRPWGPYWVALWIYVLWMASARLRSVGVWCCATVMVVLGWELGTHSIFGAMPSFLILGALVFGSKSVRVASKVRKIIRSVLRKRVVSKSRRVNRVARRT